MLFSATLSVRVRELAWEYLNDAEAVEIRPQQITADRVTQVLYHVGAREKLSLLVGLLRREGAERTMLFVNTRRFAERVVATLERHGHRVAALTGDLPQVRRLRILSDFKTGKLPLLVATDVASRGLHIEGVTHVINVDLPQDPEDYVHRIGRTARVGAAGKAISLADENYVFSLGAIEKLLGTKIPTLHADDALFARETYPRAGGGLQSGGPRHLGPAEDDDEPPVPPLRVVPPPPAAAAAPETRASPPAPPPEADEPDFWTREAFGLEPPEGGFAPVAAFVPGGKKRRRRRKRPAGSPDTAGSGAAS
jgi:hypothetical protein